MDNKKSNKFGKFDKQGVLTELKINRKYWLRGDKENAYLLHDGKRCCIGFLAAAMGYSDRRLKEQCTIADIVKHPLTELQLAQEMRLATQEGFDPQWIKEAYVVNDEVETDARKEKKLKKLFGTVGVKLKFVE